MKKILIIQSAFIGDVVLATVLIEKLKDVYPDSSIDFMLRAGNEKLLAGHPKIRKVFVWNKRKNKYLNLIKIIAKVRKEKYDLIVNAHRFSSSGMVTFLSGAKIKTGFDKNPISWCYDHVIEHEIGTGKHEIERNLALIDFIDSTNEYKPVLYFSPEDVQKINDFVSGPYLVMAPASVWYTKQLPVEKWIEIIDKIPETHTACLIGGGNDIGFCEKIIKKSSHSKVKNLAGKLSFLESAALMQGAAMNFVNDSAPMHIASAVNAPTTAIFCSTVPEFGFGPLSDISHIWQVKEKLSCRPCGLHGLKKCPEGHFKCAMDIEITSPLF